MDGWWWVCWDWLFWVVITPLSSVNRAACEVTQEIDGASRLNCDARMTHTNSFRDLAVWQQAMLLVVFYCLSRASPAGGRWGWTAQGRRGVFSFPSNIGEGPRRKRRKAYLHH